MSSGSYEKVLKKLEELESTSLPESIELYVRLTRLQLEARSKIKIKETHLSQKEIDERVGLGVIALKFDELQLDWNRVKDLFRGALSIINEYHPPIDPSAVIQLGEIVELWYTLNPLPHNLMDEDILTVAVHTALKPFLSKWAELLLPRIDREKWRRGYCPVCNGIPNFAYIEPEQGARWLCCPRCDAEWLFQRLECPFCKNMKQQELAFLSDNDGRYRVYICDGCKGYIKAIDLRKVHKDIVMPLQWIETLDLDRQACERGYHAGILSTSK